MQNCRKFLDALKLLDHPLAQIKNLKNKLTNCQETSTKLGVCRKFVCDSFHVDQNGDELSEIVPGVKIGDFWHKFRREFHAKFVEKFGTHCGEMSELDAKSLADQLAVFQAAITKWDEAHFAGRVTLADLSPFLAEYRHVCNSEDRIELPG